MLKISTPLAIEFILFLLPLLSFIMWTLPCRLLGHSSPRTRSSKATELNSPQFRYQRLRTTSRVFAMSFPQTAPSESRPSSSILTLKITLFEVPEPEMIVCG
ncbi:hypothetical protein FRC02_002440 [Tulasnella sp. 418]|nr:hypothetical protein FRC02_002440 [Tulasnella sp. 418]